MSQLMPDLVDPWRLAALGKRFSGRIPLANFSRLVALLLNQDGDVVYELAFQKDRLGRSCVLGSVEAMLRLECQRCLQPMDFVAASVISLGVIESLDEVELLPKRYEPLLVENGYVKPLDLLEDELLLALPQIPVHAEGTCAVRSSGDRGDDGPGIGGSRQQNPFAALAKLKRN